MISSEATGRIGQRLRREFGQARVRRRLAGLCFVVGTIVSVLLAVLALRAALRLELRWDTFAYHIPFAAIRGGIEIPFEINAHFRGFFEGFPPLPHIVQGLLWRATGSINATGVVNYGALLVFLIFCARKLQAPFWLVAMIALTAPMVLIHATVSYVDLFTNVWLAVAVGALAHAYFFANGQDRGLLAWAMAGLVLAAWSKFVTVPIVAVLFALFFIFYATSRDLARPQRAWRLWTIAAVAVVAALPYFKNWIVYGNPFWPMQLPWLGELFPYAIALNDFVPAERPPPLRGESQFWVFLHSLFEIDHPTHYAHRERRIIDQGNAWIAFRSGGFWAPSVVVFLVSALGMAIANDRRKGLVLGVAIIATVCFVSVLPQSHVSRFYLFLPLSWAALIGMSFPLFRRRHPRLALGMLIVWFAMFGYVTDINRSYYRVERIGYAEAAAAWGASQRWSHLRSGVTYCSVDMEPVGILLTGPTMSEFRVVDRRKAASCPAGAQVIRKSQPGPR